MIGSLPTTALITLSRTGLGRHSERATARRKEETRFVVDGSQQEKTVCVPIWTSPESISDMFPTSPQYTRDEAVARQ